MSFKELVIKRKIYKVELAGFVNPSQVESGRYDKGEYFDTWGKWHSNVPADILVIGQDWGDVKYYLKNAGQDSDSNPTCKNLCTLFNEAGVDIGTPNHPKKNVSLHLTNLIPFLRTGKMQGSEHININQKLIHTYALEFLKPLIEVVKPKAIITLGQIPFQGVASIFDLVSYSKEGLLSLVNKSSIRVGPDLMVFPMFHCGSMSINMNRTLNQQKRDWAKLKEFIKPTNEMRDLNDISIPRNLEAQRYFKEMSEIILCLQEVYSLEAIYNDLRLADVKKYNEQWRAIREKGYQLGNRLKELAGKF